jgi:hypothetical protein
MIWNDAITNRTKQDVNHVKELNYKLIHGTMTQDEKAEWLTDLKGALNLSDLRRIKNNIELLNIVLELNLTISAIPEIPDENYYSELLTNVQSIYNTNIHYRATPRTPQQPLNLYTKWNDIEKILEDTYNVLNNNFFYYCGDDYYCGDEIGLLL